MNIVCPGCHAEMTLDVVLASEEARQAVGRLLAHSLPVGAVAMRYIALFRPEKRRMSIDRMCKLVEELQPDLQRQAITRKGRDWVAPPELWRQAMEAVLAKRDKGTLTLPLTGHGLLHEIICGLVEKAEAAAERMQEELRRGRRSSGPQGGGPRDLSAMAEALGDGAVVMTTATPAPTYAGPSKAALALRAQIDEAQRRRSGGTGDEEPAAADDAAESPIRQPRLSTAGGEEPAAADDAGATG